MRALRARKHVYCAKPLTHTIFEARQVAAQARAANVATQMSVQSCASDAGARVTQLLASRLLLSAASAASPWPSWAFAHFEPDPGGDSSRSSLGGAGAICRRERSTSFPGASGSR
jgi:predicted dehydrogenase